MTNMSDTEIERIRRAREAERALAMIAVRRTYTAPKVVDRLRKIAVAGAVIGSGADAKPAGQLPPKIRLGRNALCLCGSGKKYKKCCGAKGLIFVRVRKQVAGSPASSAGPGAPGPR